MESDRIKKLSDASKSNYGNWILWVTGVCVLLLLGAGGWAFLHNRVLFDAKLDQIDGGLWGQYGDFVGGILGSLLTFVSILLLVKTLRQQIDSSKEMSDNNDKTNTISRLKIFDNTYYRLLELYKSALEQLKSKKDINSIVNEDFRKNIKEGNKAPIQIFKDFYSQYREYAAVYFRMIYRELQYIDTSNITEIEKAQFSKIFRAQLSEAELVLLRYNALTENGLNMQSYINRYNLLKHLPLFDLLEFDKWKKDNHTSTELNHIDVMFYNLRQRIRKEFLNTVSESNTIDFKLDSKIYSIKFTIECNRSKFRLELVKNSKNSQTKTNESIDSAIERYTNEELKGLFEAFVKDVFLWSNFAQYNKEESVEIDKGINKSDINKTTAIYVSIKNNNGYPLIASQKQMQTPLGAGKS